MASYSFLHSTDSSRIVAVDGNEILFYKPERQTKIENNGVTFNITMHTGSINLDMIKGLKEFRNDKGQIYKIEKFNPNIVRIV